MILVEYWLTVIFSFLSELFGVKSFWNWERGFSSLKFRSLILLLCVMCFWADKVYFFFIIPKWLRFYWHVNSVQRQPTGKIAHLHLHSGFMAGYLFRTFTSSMSFTCLVRDGAARKWRPEKWGGLSRWGRWPVPELTLLSSSSHALLWHHCSLRKVSFFSIL